MRIQTTIVLLDGIIRNDPKHKFSVKQLDLIATIGTDIRNMLTVPLDMRRNEAAAKKLLQNMVILRRMIVDLSATVSSSPDTQIPSVIPDYSTSANITE